MSNKVRVFRTSDAAGAKKLILAILTNEYPFDRTAYSDSDLDRIAEVYGGDRETFFVIDNADKIIGTAGIKEDTKDDALLRRLFVDPHHRRHGCGSALVKAAIEFAKSNGYKRIIFRCTDRMSDAMHLCAKNGFKETEKLPVSGFNIHRLELWL